MFCYVSVENCMWKYGQEAFFPLMWNPNIKVINQVNANNFQCLIWIFEYVIYLLCGIMLIVLN